MVLIPLELLLSSLDPDPLWYPSMRACLLIQFLNQLWALRNQSLQTSLEAGLKKRVELIQGRTWIESKRFMHMGSQPPLVGTTKPA